MSEETVEQKQKRLEDLKQLKAWAKENDDKHSLAEAETEIQKLEDEIGDVDVRVKPSHKILEGDPKTVLGPSVWMGRKSRDTKLSIGSLMETRQGETKEGDKE